MNCDEFKELLVDFYDGTLDGDTSKAVEQHIEVCPECRGAYGEFDYVLHQIQDFREIEHKDLPSDEDFGRMLEESLAPERRKRNGLKSLKKLGGIVAVVAVLGIILGFSPAAAAIRTAISDFTGSIFGDKGVENSIQKGYGQSIEVSQTINGLELTVHNAVSDPNRTVLLIGAKYNDKLSETADDMTFYGMDVKNSKGKFASSGFTTQHQYDSEKQVLSGMIGLGQLQGKNRNLVLTVKAAVLSRKETLPVDIKLEGTSLRGLHKVIPLNNQVIREVVINNISVSGGRCEVDYDIVYTDRKFLQGGDFLQLLKKDGTVCSPMQSGISMRPGDQENVASVQDEYELGNLNLSDFRLWLSYPKPVKVIEGDWELRFKIDDKAAQKDTMTLTPNTSITIGDYSVKVKRVVCTPSATVVCLECKDISPLAILGRMSLKTGAGETIRTSYGSQATIEDPNTPMENHCADYQFDPIFDTKGLYLEVQTAKIPEKTDFSLELKPENTNTEKEYQIGSGKYKISYRFLPGDRVEVVLQDPSSGFPEDIMFTEKSVYIKDADGNRIFPPETQGAPIRFQDHAYTFTFSGIIPGNGVLHIDHVLRYGKLNLKLKLG